MIEVEFINSDLDVIKSGWENWLDISWYPGVAADYDEKMAKGVLFILELEKGLTMVVSDYTAKDDIVFINKSYTVENIFLFSLNYLFLGDVYVVNDKNKQEGKKYSILNKQILHHSKSNFSFVAEKAKRAKVLDVMFTHEWLLNQFTPLQRQAVQANILKIENYKPFYINKLSARSSEFVSEIINKVFYHGWNTVFLKTRVLFLVEDAIKNYFLPGSNEPERPDADETLLAMLEIKQKINNTLYEKVPNRKILAKEFLMSESTLDRRFKKVFGKSINEYHLYEKMELANRILKRDEYTVSQIAYLLGYETASAFIKSFKKHFGMPPGSLRKQE